MACSRHRHGWRACLLLALFGATAQANSPRTLPIEVVEEPIVRYDPSSRQMRYPVADETRDPLRVVVSRERYWQADGHLDLVVELNPPETITLADTTLEITLYDDNGQGMQTHAVTPPGERFVAYPALPPDWVGEGRVSLFWRAGDEVLADLSREFRVEPYHHDLPAAGRIRIVAPNPDAVTVSGLPVTVGVPFPRGVLHTIEHLRLIDALGQEIPLQVMETARWSPFGSVKWVLCDFTVDLQGEPRELFLEVGAGDTRHATPAASRVVDGRRWASMAVDSTSAGFPVIDTGRLRLGPDGVAFDARGDGEFMPVLTAHALSGAFVEHEDGRVFRPDPATPFEIEEAGPEKIVIRRSGWYVEDAAHRSAATAVVGSIAQSESVGLIADQPPQQSDTQARFCKYITRYVIHRSSPLVRMVHTWIFTGDGNRDRIANMGWSFAQDSALAPGGFLETFDAPRQWAHGERLLQYDYDAFTVRQKQALPDIPGGRAPGVARLQGDGVSLYLGVRDFWQGYPSELVFKDDALVFFNWPQQNVPRRHSFDAQQVDERDLQLNAVQLRYAHEGEMLDFRLPDEFGEDPIWQWVTGGRDGLDWPRGQVEAVNAQGVARTEQLWLYVDRDDDPTQAVKVLEGLDSERLRPVVDPAWIAASGVFYELHPRDPDQFPVEEAAYEKLALAPINWGEDLGYYGMWLHGDMAAWGWIPIGGGRIQLYRALRKAHHGWPYSFIPYARSGDPRFLKQAQASLRQLMDASFTHHVTEEVERATGPFYQRRIGLQNTGPVPWAGARSAMVWSMHNKYDNHLAAWYLLGDRTALDNFNVWASEIKVPDPELGTRIPVRLGDRGSVTGLRSFTEAWEATFDPWFLVGMHAIAEGHLDLHERRNWQGHFYNTGDREFHRFTGDRRFAEYYLDHARIATHKGGHSWARIGAPMAHINAYAYTISGEPHYLRRAAELPDWLKAAVFLEADPPRLEGFFTWGGHATVIYTGWALQYLPTMLAYLAQADSPPEVIPNNFEVQFRGNNRIALQKVEGKPLRVRFAAELGRLTQPPETFVLRRPDGAVLDAKFWSVHTGLDLRGGVRVCEIAADAPGGVYWIDFDGRTADLELPVSQTDWPEVFVIGEGEPVRLGSMQGQAWFRVPESVTSFTVDFPIGSRTERSIVWDPDGQPAWELHHSPSRDPDRSSPVRAQIEVDSRHRGRLWRITRSPSASFTLDPAIPPIFAVTPSKWFDPGPIPEPPQS